MSSILRIVILTVAFNIGATGEAFAQKPFFGIDFEYGHDVVAIQSQEDGSTVAQFYSPSGVTGFAVYDHFFLGPETGFGFDYSWIVPGYSGSIQNLADPTAEPEPTTPESSFDAGNQLFNTSIGPTFGVIYIIGRKNNHPFRLFYGVGYVLSHFSGDVFLTHSQNRSPECATAVESNPSQISSDCEKLSIDTWSTNKFTQSGFRWSVYNGQVFGIEFSSAFGYKQTGPVKIDLGDYTLSRVSSPHWFISFHSVIQ